MKKRINVAELLKDCPKGMELDCTMYENVELDFIEQNPESIYPIHCLLKLNGGCNTLVFTHNGCSDRHPNAKCVIFPKGKTTWKGFVPPCKYKAGDVLVSRSENIVLLSHIDSENIVHYHCIIPTYGNFRIEENTGIGVGKYYNCVLANEQQRQLIYDKIKSSGYKYNQHINKLEKLIVPKFKVGDRIKSVISSCYYTVVNIDENSFYIKSDTEPFPYEVALKHEGNYELAPNKFDITTLEPFESRVLIRDRNNEEWRGQFFSHYNKCSDRPYICIGNEGLSEYKQCIPYKCNEHLLSTTDDCDEYYKTWE